MNRPLYKVFSELLNSIEVGNIEEISNYLNELKSIELPVHAKALLDGIHLKLKNKTNTIGIDVLNYFSDELPKRFCGIYEKYPDTTGKRQAEGGLRLSLGINKRIISDEPLVTIITAVYNNSTTFERCINSVLDQTYRNIEYIVIDGGSDQPTLDVINKYSDKIDYYVSEPDDGIYNAMNKGIELASGDYICLLNSDDFYETIFVSECIKLANNKNSSIVYTYYKVGSIELKTEGINEGVFLGHLNICHNTFLVSKDCYDRIGKYAEDYQIVSDAVWIRKAFRGKVRFDLLEESMFTLTEGGLSSGSTPENRKLFISEVVRSYVEQFDFLSEEDAEDIYLFRFDKSRVPRIIRVAKKYLHDKEFISSLSSYVGYCFKNRDNFKLSHTESDTLFLEYIKISDLISVPKSTIKINTNQGCFSQIIKSIDLLVNNKKKKSRKTILHFVSVFSAPSETFIYDLLSRLENETIFDNYILFEHRQLESERPYKKSIFIPWGDFKKEVRDELYKYIFSQLNPDIILAHFALNEWKLAQRIKPLGISVPTISMTHGIDVFMLGRNQEYTDYIINVFCKRSDARFTSVSNYLCSSLEDRGVHKDKISIVNNAVGEAFFSSRKTNNYFEGNRTLDVLAIGRMIELKGHIFLLQGIDYFKRNIYPDVRLTIVFGNGKDFYDETLSEVERLGLSSNVTFIPFVDFAKETDFISRYDIFVQPSTYSKDKLNRSESFGMAPLEAITAGLPVIVTDAGGLPEVIGKPNKFAIIVPHSNGAAIGRALQKFFEDEACFSDNIDYARGRLEKFSGERQISLLTKEILNICGTPLRATLFSTSTVQGAGYAAFRVLRGLAETSIKPTLFTTVRDHDGHPNVNVVPHPTGNGNAWKVLQNPANSKPGLTIFTVNHPALSPEQISTWVKDSDVINLHWTARFLSIENIAQLSNLGKPLVMTIRDMQPITGGCHFFHGCTEMKNNCSNCPQLVDTFNNYPNMVLESKRKYYNFENITIVTLSKHTAGIIKSTPYFNQCRLEVIPNSIETDIFKPYDKLEARKILELPLDRKIIGYVPSFSSEVKGYKEVVASFDILIKKYTDIKPFVMLVGNKTPANEEIKLDNQSLGYISDNEKLAIAYSAADVVVVPSLEETFSNTTAESIACGTPVVGFKTGAIPDMVQDGFTGYTYNVGDVYGLAEGIYKVLTENNMSQNCRDFADNNLSFMLQARKYEDLFYELYAYNIEDNDSNSSSAMTCFPETAQTVLNMMASKLVSSREF